MNFPGRCAAIESALPVSTGYFAIVDEFGHEKPVMADAIERALCKAENLECLGATDPRASVTPTPSRRRPAKPQLRLV